MTINQTSSALNTNAAALLKTSSPTSSLSKTELTQEEQQYDIDNDGELSITEKATMQEAQAAQEALKSSTSTAESISDTAEISEEALKLQKQERPEQSKENVKAEDNRQRLYNEAISEYKKFNVS